MSNKLSVIIIGAEGRMGKIHAENIKTIAQKHNVINKIYLFDIAYQKDNVLPEDKKASYTLFHNNNFSSLAKSIKPILSSIGEKFNSASTNALLALHGGGAKWGCTKRLAATHL